MGPTSEEEEGENTVVYLYYSFAAGNDCLGKREFAASSSRTAAALKAAPPLWSAYSAKDVSGW
jgi:hypothetical protein